MRAEMEPKEMEELRYAVETLRRCYAERMFDGEYDDARLIVCAAIGHGEYGLVRSEDVKDNGIEVI